MILPRAARLALVERENPELPLTRQVDLLSLARASLYYQPALPSPEEVALKHRIDALYTAYPFYGSRRITAVLQREGVMVNRKAVQRHMQEMGIAGVAPGPHPSTPAPRHPVYPYLLRHVTSAWPNHVWGIDITYIKMEAGWLYLVAVLDWYSRYVVSWELDLTLELPFVLAATARALMQATPQIWNSDQGSHFTSPQYLALLQAADVAISMDGKGRAPRQHLHRASLAHHQIRGGVSLQLHAAQGGAGQPGPLRRLLQPPPAAPSPGLPHPRRGLLRQPLITERAAARRKAAVSRPPLLGKERHLP